tara:strand:- start:1619 stop:2401 length:783 start_codon:yes stop_codon:yes gene_type:complete
MDNSNIIENYNKTYDFNKKEVIKKYIEIVLEYLKLCSSSLIVIDRSYYNFIVNRGLQTIFHCFNIVYLYSKNLNIVEKSCKGAICYYVEFMGQIGEDSNSYLQLNSKDATLFVYKKILFDINEDYRKHFKLNKEETIFLKELSISLNFINSILNNYLSFNNNEINKKNMEIMIKYSIKCIEVFLKYDNTQDDIEIINYFTSHILKHTKEIKNYTSICENFIKKINKNSLSKKTINIKLEEIENTDFNNMKPSKLVSWFFK